MTERSNIIVFDLDDTLYKEIDFLKSATDHTRSNIATNAQEKMEKVKEGINDEKLTSLALRVASAQERAQQKNEMAGDGKSPFANAMALLAVDNAKKLSEQYIEHVGQDIERREKEAEKGNKVAIASLPVLKEQLKEAERGMQMLKDIKIKTYGEKEQMQTI